jgi:hypothetical protein
VEIVKKLKKIVIGFLCGISILVIHPIGANAEWKQDSTGWWYANNNSWYTSWKQINNQWYYFEQDGYMAHDTIIDNYYLNSDGIYSNGGKEIKAYSNALNDNNWLKNNDIIFRNGKSCIEKVVILDINQNGVFDMLIHNGTCSADYKVSVFTYNNGNIQKLKDIQTFSGGYLGYSPLKKVFFVTGGHMDHYYTDGYKIENNQCINVYSSTDDVKYSRDNNGYLISSTHDYIIDNKAVSEEEYNNHWKQFGNIKK